MKIRNGFVSNSSSSSFIVSCKDKKSAKIKVELEVDLYDHADDKITTLKELDGYFIDRYGWGGDTTLEAIFEDNEGLKEDYIKAKKAIECGELVLFGSFSNESDDPASMLLCDMGIEKYCDGKLVKCIQGEGGY